MCRDNPETLAARGTPGQAAEDVGYESGLFGDHADVFPQIRWEILEFQDAEPAHLTHDRRRYCARHSQG